MLDKSARSRQAARNTLGTSPAGDAEGESWLMSYLDVLTLLITLFVVLLSLSGNGSSVEGAENAGIPGTAAQLGPTIAPLGAGLMPQNDGLKQEFREMDLEGVSMAESEKGITLRIDNSLLFASGDASLTHKGRALIQELVPTIEELDGDVSIEGHTDNVPIHTARFPSNWELSTRRATSVLRHLVESGLPREGVRAIGYADTKPLESNESFDGRAANRRVELLVTHKAGQTP